MESSGMRERTKPTVRHWAMIVFAAFACWPSTSWAGGWYLMVAPPMEDSNREHKLDLSRPLNVWDQRESFDSAKACEAARIRELAGHAALIAIASLTDARPDERFNWKALSTATEQWLLSGDSTKISPPLLQPIARAVLALKPGYLCIGTDDPRLR